MSGNPPPPNQGLSRQPQQQSAAQPGQTPPQPVMQPVLPRFMLPFQQQIQLWQGQYPPPEAVERYEKVLPGAFNRILTMAEGLQAAQIREAEHTNNYAHSDIRRAHYLGALIAIFAMLGALGRPGEGVTEIINLSIYPVDIEYQPIGFRGHCRQVFLYLSQRLKDLHRVITASSWIRYFSLVWRGGLGR
jgi:uncharacterized membrane protein